MANVIVFEPASTGRFYLKEIADRGLVPVAVYPAMGDGVSALYKSLRDASVEYAESLSCETVFLDGDLEAGVEEVLERFDPVAVMAGSELGVQAADLAARRHGLRGNDPATSERRRDKFLMACALEEAGLDHVRSARVASVEECLRTAEEWGSWPLVVKPLSSAGTQGVHFCHGMQSLAECAGSVLSGTDLFGSKVSALLLQEYASGVEYIVNTVSFEGIHSVTDVWRYRKIPVGDEGNAYDYALLEMELDDEASRVVDYALDCLTALGFEYGPSHTEVMLTERGPLLIETGARPMGAVHDLGILDRALGHHILDVSLDAYLDPEASRAFADRPYRPALEVMTKVLVSQREGDIVSAPAALLLERLPTSARGDLSLSLDRMRTERTVDLATTPGEWQFCGAPEEVMADYAIVRRLETEAFDLLFSERPVRFRMPRISAVLPDGGRRAFGLSGEETSWEDAIVRFSDFRRGLPEGSAIEADGLDGMPPAAWSTLLGMVRDSVRA